jgi:hypothetical protein
MLNYTLTKYTLFLKYNLGYKDDRTIKRETTKTYK